MELVSKAMTTGASCKRTKAPLGQHVRMTPRRQATDLNRVGKTLLDGEGDDLDRNALRQGMMGCVQDLHEVPLNDRRADAERGDGMSVSITSKDRV